MTTDELKSIYRNKKWTVDKLTGKETAGFKNTTLTQFTDWFNQEKFDKGCHYCGTKNEESFFLYNLQRTGLREDGTRGGKRGRRLEIDRKDPFKPYDDLKNLVWCCYWCNNAKSNFFTEEEFHPIAGKIGEAIQQILKTHNYGHR